MGKELLRSTKGQHLKTLQRALDDIVWHLSVRTYIVATTGMLKLTLALGFCLDHRDNLVTGLHHFVLRQHISDTRKVLKDRTNQHQVIVGGGDAPSLADAATLTSPDGLYLLATLDIARGPHTQLRVVLFTLIGTYHSTTLEMKELNTEIIEREMEI